MTATIISRAAWGARAPKRITRIAGPVRGVAGHYEGSGLGSYPPDSVAAIVRQIQNFHMDTRGWDDIAYSALVDRFGRVWEGRGPGRRSAANGTNDSNDHYYAVCLIMGPADTLTPDMKRGWLDARAWLQTHGNAGPETPPHSTFIATACPGPARNWFLNGCPAPGDSPTPTPAPTPQPDNNDYSVETEVAQLPTVQQGSNGQFVRICQGLLVANGRSVGVDGDFGAKTTAALTDFQGAVGLDTDGVCGPKTWRRLLCV